MYKTFSKIASDNSQTASHIGLGITEREYHVQYERNLDDIRSIQAGVALFCPDLIGVAEELSGLVNQFWGNQQCLLYQHSRKMEEAAQITLTKIIGVGSRIEVLVHEAH
jgi:hypothetical protein